MSAAPIQIVNEVPSYIEGLDGLRGCAALLVVGGHLTTQLIAVPGVYLFFILSAFLLTHQFLSWDVSRFADARSLAHYLQRRFFRIVPLFAATVLISAWTTSLGITWNEGYGIPLTVRPTEVVPTLTFRAGPEILWTIPVEFKFYIALPVIALLLVTTAKISRVTSLLLSILSLLLAYAWINPSRHSLALVPFLPLFLTGSNLAVVHRLVLTSTSIELNRTFKVCAEMLAWFAIGGFAFTMPIVQRLTIGVALPREEMVLMHALYGALFASIIFGVVHGSGVLRSMLETRLAKWMGAISFSLYLFHIGPIRALDAVPQIHPYFGGAIAVVIAIAISSFTYVYFERPILRATSGWLRPTMATHCESGYESSGKTHKSKAIRRLD